MQCCGGAGGTHSLPHYTNKGWAGAGLPLGSVGPTAQKRDSPDIQGPLLACPEGPRPRAHAAVHHLFSQVMYLRLKATVLCQEDKGKGGERMKPKEPH